MKRVLLMFGLILMFLAPQAFAAEATFENLVPPTAYTGPGGGAYYKGSDGANGFASGDAWFGNSYYPSYGGWAGFAYSNTTDTTTSGYTNQFSAYAIGSSGKKSKGVAAAAWKKKTGCPQKTVTKTQAVEKKDRHRSGKKA